MPRVSSSWSRAEWVRRLGFKTGDQPPIGAAITPTLASGDASQLLPTLLAPQGWAGGGLTAAAYGAVEIQSLGIGGCFVELELGPNPPLVGAVVTWVFEIVPTRRGSYTATITPTIWEESPGVQSRITLGSDTAAITDGPFIKGETNTQPPGMNIFVPSGSFLYAVALGNNQITVAAHLRDVPAGNATD